MDQLIVESRNKSVIKEFLSNIKNNDNIEMFGFNISYPIGEDEIRMSFLGEINEIYNYLNQSISELKFNKKEFLDWIDNLFVYLSKTYPKREGVSEIISKLNIQGLL